MIVLSPTGEPAARAAQSHTGSLVSSRRVVEAALRDAGALLVATPEELMETAQGLLMPRRPRGRRVAIVSDGGGIAVIAAGVLAADGFAVPELSDRLQAQLRDLRPGAASTRNPVDLTAVMDDLHTYPRVLDAVIGSGEVDAAVLVGSFGTMTHEEPGRRTRRRPRRRSPPPRTRWSPPCSGRASRRSVGSGRAACRPSGASARPAAPSPPRPRSSSTRRGRRRTGRRPPRRFRRPATWTPAGCWRRPVCPFAPAEEARDVPEALAAAERLGYPVVLKALAGEHKSDAGGVVLGLATPDALAAAVAEVAARLAPPSFSVERMVRAPVLAELACGVIWDPRFGPVAMVGGGGTAVELLDDVVLALAPLEPDEAAARCGGCGRSRCSTGSAAGHASRSIGRRPRSPR